MSLDTPELCSEVADGVTRNIVCLFREPDAGNPPVRFDEREQETEPCQTGLRRRRESFVSSHRETTVTAPVLDSTQNARNRDSECNGISTVVRLRLRARELHQLVGLRSGKRLRCEVFEGNSKQAILWCVLRTGLLGENQQSEGFRNHFRPGMRILGRGGRWRSEVGSHGIDVVVLGVEGHGSGTGAAS